MTIEHLYAVVEEIKQRAIEICQDTFKQVPPHFDLDPTFVRRDWGIEAHQPAYPNQVMVITFYDSGETKYEMINIWE